MRYHLLLGGNEGDVDQNMAAAIDLIREGGGVVVGVSRVYVSEPWGYESDNLFHNVAAIVDISLGPREFLASLKEIERMLGRKRKTAEHVYQDRPIDIDILLCEDMVISTDDLEIPHPRMAERRFALAPLAEISPDVRHPLLKKSIKEMLDECEDCGVVSLAGNICIGRL